MKNGDSAEVLTGHPLSSISFTYLCIVVANIVKDLESLFTGFRLLISAKRLSINLRLSSNSTSKMFHAWLILLLVFTCSVHQQFLGIAFLNRCSCSSGSWLYFFIAWLNSFFQVAYVRRFPSQIGTGSLSRVLAVGFDPRASAIFVTAAVMASIAVDSGLVALASVCSWLLRAVGWLHSFWYNAYFFVICRKSALTFDPTAATSSSRSSPVSHNLFAILSCIFLMLRYLASISMNTVVNCSIWGFVSNKMSNSARKNSELRLLLWWFELLHPFYSAFWRTSGKYVNIMQISSASFSCTFNTRETWSVWQFPNKLCNEAFFYFNKSLEMSIFQNSWV